MKAWISFLSKSGWGGGWRELPGPGWGCGSGIMALGLEMIISGWKQDQGKLVDTRQQILKPVVVACLTRGHFMTEAVEGGHRIQQLNSATSLVTRQSVCSCDFVCFVMISTLQEPTWTKMQRGILSCFGVKRSWLCFLTSRSPDV